MNALDIFSSLTKGLKFDKKRFAVDFKKLGHTKQSNIQEDVKDQSSNNIAFPIKVSSESDWNNVKEEGEVEEEIKVEYLDDVKEEKTVSKKKLSLERALQLEREQINHLRRKNIIHARGSDIPAPVDTFEKLQQEFNVNPIIISNLIAGGYLTPTPVQMQVWPLMLKGREILTIAPTGSGKTAAFLLPLIHNLKHPTNKGFRAVIVSPTRELAKQTFRECKRLCDGIGLRIFLMGHANKAIQIFTSQSSPKFDILITTPKRLVFVLGQEPSPLSLAEVRWLIIDESDRLFEGGLSGFRDQIAVIYQACTHSGILRGLFSATIGGDVEEWCKLNLNDLAIINIGMRNSACSDVSQELLFCGNESGKLMALKNMLRKGYEPPVLVFVQTKDRAKQLLRELLFESIMVDAIHADRSLAQRDNVVKAFRERKIWVLICTELMSRGIDFKGVNMVINYDFPPTTISYIHRVGRTGRAKHLGKAITFWTLEDETLLKSVASIINHSGSDIPQWMLDLKKPSYTAKKEFHYNQPDRGRIGSNKVNAEELKKSTKGKKRKHKNDGSEDKKKGAEPVGQIKKKEAPSKKKSKNIKIPNRNVTKPKLKPKKLKTP